MEIKKGFYSLIAIVVLTMVLVVTPSAKPASAAYNFYDLGTWPVVGYGYKTSGPFVRAVQANLWSANLRTTVGTVDGYFGSGTFNGVKAYQRMEGLGVDGIVGKQMWTEMEDHTVYKDSHTRRFVHNSATYVTDFIYYADGNGTSYAGYLKYKTTGGVAASIGTLWSVR